MPLAQKLKFHDYQFEFDTPSGKWRWTTRLDVSNSSPEYSVRDIRSPYGLLRDSIPIPGAIVQAMSDSIEELKANFTPNVIVGPPAYLSFEVDEGSGYSNPQTIPVTNGGVYGSILSASVTTSAPYVRVTPTTVGNLAINESGEVSVEVTGSNLLSTSSPYHEAIVIEDPTASNGPQTVPIQIVVRPKSEITVPVNLLIFSVVRPLDGAYEPVPSQSFLVSNTGPTGSVLDYDIRALTGMCSNWLISWLPSADTLPAGQSQSISVTVQPRANQLAGTYTEKLRVAGYSSNSYVDVEIRLVIS